MYRCDIRSVQQESGGGRRGLRREPQAKGANGATSIGDAWGVRTRARAGGGERRNQGHKRRGTDAGEPGGGEPPRRLSGGECGGSEGGRVEHTAGGASSGRDTSARGSAEAGESEARSGRSERGAAAPTTSAASRTARGMRCRRRRRAEPTPGGFEVNRRSGRGAAPSWASPACRAALW